MVSYTAALLVFIVGFGFLIFVHELGHFLVAKWAGIRCTQFAIGFGPAIVSWRKGIGLRLGSTEPEYERRIEERLKEQGKDLETATQEEAYTTADATGMGETEYRLNYVPLGGYVKMLGQEDLDPNAVSRDPRSYTNKSVGARFAVISAGVTMNMIFGFLFFLIAFRMGVDFPPAVVGGVQPGLPAATTYAAGHEGDPQYRGLRVGDRVLAVDGDVPTDWTDVRIAAALAAEGDPIDLIVERYGEPEPLRYTLLPEYDTGEELLSLGIMQPQSLEVVATFEGSDPAEAGVKPGMQVVSVAGQPVEDYAAYHRAITSAEGRPVEVVFADPESGERVTVPLQAQPPLAAAPGEPINAAGFVPAVRVAGFAEDSPAQEAGVLAGDVIASIGGTSWPSADQVSLAVEAATEAGRPIDLVVLRDGEPVTLDAIQPRSGRLGIAMQPILDEPIIATAIEGTAAATAAVPGGARLLSVAGQEVGSWRDLYTALAAIEPQGDTIRVPVRYRLAIGAEGVVEETELTLTAEAATQLRQAAWEAPGGLIFEFAREPVKAESAWEALALGARKTKQIVLQSYVMLLRLVQGSVGPDQLHGPVGITAVGARVTQYGFSYLLYFLGLLSVSLAVINFLPIPIADGGHAVFLLIEKIKGSPVSPAVQQAALYVGLAIFAFIFLFVTYNDIFRIATGG